MLATVNSRRRSVSRGPDDQAQGVVMGGGEGEQWGVKAEGMHVPEEDVRFWVTFVNRFSPSSFGRIRVLRDAPDFGVSGAAGKSIDKRFLRKADCPLTVSGVDLSPRCFCST